MLITKCTNHLRLFSVIGVCFILGNCRPVDVNVKPVQISPVDLQSDVLIGGNRDVYIDLTDLKISVSGPAGSGICSAEGAFRQNIESSIRDSFVNLVRSIYINPTIFFRARTQVEQSEPIQQSYTVFRPTEMSASIKVKRGWLQSEINYNAQSKISLATFDSGADKFKWNVYDAFTEKGSTVLGFGATRCGDLGREFSRILQASLKSAILDARSKLRKYHHANISRS